MQLLFVLEVCFFLLLDFELQTDRFLITFGFLELQLRQILWPRDLPEGFQLQLCTWGSRASEVSLVEAPMYC